MAKDGSGKMFCLAGIGGRVSGIMKSTEAAQAILAIDGCPLNCTKKSLEEAGFDGFNHLQIADLGLKNGETEINNVNIAMVAEKGTFLLQEVS